MSMKKIKVLLAEDEKDLRILIAEELEKQGYEVYQAADGEEALALTEKVRPDVILSDVLMPKKSGNDFLKELKETDFGKNIPFIILTARAGMRDYFEVVKVDGFLEKPFKINEVVQQIEHVIRRDLKDYGAQKEKIEKLKEQDSLDSVSTPESMIEGVIGQQEEGDDGGVLIGGASLSVKKRKKVYKILLAEDDDQLCAKVEEIFFKNGLLAHIARNPSKCLEGAISYLPNVIFIKEILCEMRADNLIDLLRGAERTQDIPVIVYGGLGLEKRKKEILNKKGVSILVYDGESQLLERIDALLEGDI